MKKLSLPILVFLIFISAVVLAQNKTLGVGVTTPNSNAALHVESPTSNQGFIMPRLTTAQRTAMSTLLTGGDNGLMLYDTDLKAVFIWDGVAWKSSQQVAQADKLKLPYADTLVTAPNNSNIFSLVYNGTATESVGIASFVNLNPNNNFQPLFVRNFGTNGAGYFQVSNTGGLSPALRGLTDSNQANAHAILGSTTGTGGSAGVFSVNNAANSQPALFATTNGAIGTDVAASAAILAETSTAFSAITARVPAGAGQSNAISGITRSTDPGSWAGYFSAETGTAVYATTKSNVGGELSPVAIYGESTGTGSNAAAFRINNAGNTFPSIFAETNGTETSHVFYGNQIGLGRAGHFQINNTSNASAAIFAATNGTGSAARFEVNNAASLNPALVAQSVSNLGGTPGSAAMIEALGTGRGLTVEINNAANTSRALTSTHAGSGRAGHFQTTNASNDQATLYVDNNSTTAGSSALFARSTGTQPVIIANHTGGSGNIAEFQNNGTTVASIDKNGFFNGNVNIAPSSVTSAINGADITPLSVSAITPSTTQSAAQFQIVSTENTSPAISAATNGQGSAAKLDQTNTEALEPALAVSTAAQGTALNATSTSTNARVAEFISSNPGNTREAVYIHKQGTGNAITVDYKGSGGYVAEFRNNSMPVAYIDQSGLHVNGDIEGTFVGTFEGNIPPASVLSVVNSSAISPSAISIMNGSGSALMINNTGSGYSAEFQNNGSTVASIDNNGNYSGGIGPVKLSVTNVSVPGTIDAKASLINITQSGEYTLGTTGREEGEIIYITRDAEGVTLYLDAGQTRVLQIGDLYSIRAAIFVNGSWRGL